MNAKEAGQFETRKETSTRRRTRLFKPIDEAAARCEVGRATLYRWIRGKKLSPAAVRKDGGFTYVDVYEVNDIIRQPRFAGRRLEIQRKLQKKRSEESQKNRDPEGTNWIRDVDRINRRIARLFETRPVHTWPEHERTVFIIRAEPFVRRFVEAGGRL